VYLLCIVGIFIGGISLLLKPQEGQAINAFDAKLLRGQNQLILLNRFATPLDRVFLLLALNCGFGVAEIASLTIEEVCLFQGHSPRDQELLHYETTDRDSFIKRVRPKSGVYGEFLLFEQTVQGLTWALKRRRKQPDFHPANPLFLNGRGERFDKPTKQGNRNQQIPNQFARLRKRIRNENQELTNLSFGKLRKTAADLIRRFADGEVAGVFLCHGQPVRTDDLALIV
jgi:integrase